MTQDGDGAHGRGRDLDTVFAPPNGVGDTEAWQLPGADSGAGPEADAGKALGQGENVPALVPYLDVLGSYRDAATRTIERPGFPAARRDLVRDYFDSLAR